MTELQRRIDALCNYVSEVWKSPADGMTVAESYQIALKLQAITRNAHKTYDIVNHIVRDRKERG